MLDRILTPDEVEQLETHIARLQAHRDSLAEDVQHGIPVQPQIDEIDKSIDSAQHMIRKYGKPVAIRPKRRRG